MTNHEQAHTTAAEPRCNTDPGTGRVYDCTALDCPVHGDRNWEQEFMVQHGQPTTDALLAGDDPEDRPVDMLDALLTDLRRLLTGESPLSNWTAQERQDTAAETVRMLALISRLRESVR